MNSEKARYGREFIEWLAGRAGRVRELEAKLNQALGRTPDPAGEAAYRELLREKARLLAALYDEGRPLLDRLNGADAAGCLGKDELEQALETLAEISEDAGRALSLNSSFYMSALLYPEEHQPGEPNDLDLFLETMREYLEVIS